jgi:hypothetical protein
LLYDLRRAEKRAEAAAQHRAAAARTLQATQRGQAARRAVAPKVAARQVWRLAQTAAALQLQGFARRTQAQVLVQQRRAQREAALAAAAGVAADAEAAAVARAAALAAAASAAWEAAAVTLQSAARRRRAQFELRVRRAASVTLQAAARRRQAQGAAAQARAQARASVVLQAAGRAVAARRRVKRARAAKAAAAAARWDRRAARVSAQVAAAMGAADDNAMAAALERDRFKPGAAVEARYKGRFEWFAATVKSVRATGPNGDPTAVDLLYVEGWRCCCFERLHSALVLFRLFFERLRKWCSRHFYNDLLSFYAMGDVLFAALSF